MGLIKFGYTIDMYALENPETSESFFVGYDLDGVLKQRDWLGNVTPIGTVTSITGAESNFFLSNTGLDALGNKTSSIYRSGELRIGTTQSYTQMSGSTFSIYTNNGGTPSLYFSIDNNSLVINNTNTSGDKFYWDPLTGLKFNSSIGSSFYSVFSSKGLSFSSIEGVIDITAENISISGGLNNSFIFATATGFKQNTNDTLTLLPTTLSGNKVQYYQNRSGTFSLVDDVINSSLFYLAGSTNSVIDNKTQSIYRTGNIGIGTASPSTKLHIYATQSGAFRLQDGTQANNYILTSDSNGLASWTPLSNLGISGSASYIPKFTGTSSLGNSNFIDNGSSGSYNGANSNSVTFIPGSDVFLRLFRTQSAMNFILGNPSSQVGQIQSQNTLGFDLSSQGYLSFSAGASYSEVMRISSNGNIGIGLTVSTDVKLHVYATQSGYGFRLHDGSEGNKYILTSNGIGMGSWTSSIDVTRFRLNDGTQGPGYVLTSDATGVATWVTPDSTNWFRDITNTIYNTNTGAIFLFGITSSAPDNLTGGGLIIQGSNANNTLYGGNNSNTAIITFMPSANNVFPVDNAVSGIQSCDFNYGNVRAGIYFQSEIGNQGRPAIIFRIGGSTLPEVMRISQLGNIGIGTTQSQMKLHIKGTQSTILGGGTTPGIFRLEDGTQGPGYILTSDADGVASWTASVKPVIETNSNYILNNSDNGGIVIFTATASLTISTGLDVGFECTFVTLENTTLTVIPGSNTLYNNISLVLQPELSFTLKRRVATDQFITSGNL